MVSNKNSSISFKFHSFAGVDTCEITLTPLTVIAGPNSAGKTYVVYAIYSLLKNIRNFLPAPIKQDTVNELIRSGHVELDVSYLEDYDYSKHVSRIFKSRLPFFFSVSEDFFADATVEITVPKPNIVAKPWSLRTTIRKGFILEISKLENSTQCSVVISSEGVEGQQDEIASRALPMHFVGTRLASMLTQLIFADLIFEPFAITSERTGISLFWKELDISKNQIIDKLIASKGRRIDPWELIEDETSRYALPITDNIDVARDAENVSKSKSFIASDPDKLKYIRTVFDKITGGRYRYSQEGISFEYTSGRRKSIIPIYVASSSTKSLFLLDLFINNIATPGSFLMFDEPELNLHPANQRLMAQLIARLVSLGVNVVITTHSDFLIRELNNRVMLSKEFDGRDNLMRRAGIDSMEALGPSDVSGYLLTKERKLMRVDVDELGINMRSIDEAIAASATLQGSILSSMTIEASK